jgi:hypothetical protein
LEIKGKAERLTIDRTWKRWFLWAWLPGHWRPWRGRALPLGQKWGAVPPPPCEPSAALPAHVATDCEPETHSSRWSTLRLTAALPAGQLCSQAHSDLATCC